MIDITSSVTFGLSGHTALGAERSRPEVKETEISERDLAKIAATQVAVSMNDTSVLNMFASFCAFFFFPFFLFEYV